MRVDAQQFCCQFRALGEVDNACAALRVADIAAGTLPQGTLLCNKYSSVIEELFNASSRHRDS